MNENRNDKGLPSVFAAKSWVPSDGFQKSHIHPLADQHAHYLSTRPHMAVRLISVSKGTPGRAVGATHHTTVPPEHVSA